MTFPAGPILPTTAQIRETSSTPSGVYAASANGGAEQVGSPGSAAEIPVDSHIPGPGGMYFAGFQDNWRK